MTQRYVRSPAGKVGQVDAQVVPRYAGLAKAFPFAVTCDFKAFQLDANDEHPRYDLNRCFQTGWDAGYRGPWCFEHFNSDLKGLVRGMGILRDRIRQWTREAQGR